MIAQVPDLNAILKHHEIPPKFWPEIHRLLKRTLRPSDELRPA